MKKYLSLLISVLLLTALLPSAVYADPGNELVSGNELASENDLSSGDLFAADAVSAPAEEAAPLEAMSTDEASSAVPLTLGKKVTEAKNPANEWTYNWYKFTISSGCLNLTGESAARFSITLYNGNQSWVWTSGEISGKFSYPLYLTKGSYYLRFERTPEKQGTLSFTASFKETAESFPETGDGINQEKANASAISVGKEYTAQFAINDYIDCYKFTLKKAGRLAFSFKGISEASSIYLELTGDNTYAWASDNIKPVSGKLSFDKTIDLTAGTYYLFSMNSEGTGGSYTFKFTFTSADESFPEVEQGSNNDESKASAIKLNTTYTGQLAHNDTSDYYRFTLPSSGRVTLSAKTAVKGVAYLFTGPDYYYFSSKVSPDTKGRCDHTMTVDLIAGTYYLGVLKEDEDTGPYTLKVSFTDAKESFKEDGRNINDEAVNSSPISLNRIYKGQLAANDYSDYYTFTMEKKGEVTLSITAADGPFTYFLHDEDWTISWESGNVTPVGGKAEKTVKLILEPATYYFYAVLVDYEHTGNYSFTLSYEEARIPMYRVYNPNSGEHFYTASEGEKTHLVAVGWKDEGIGWYAPMESAEPVYRLYNANAGDHHYTMSAGEKDMLVSVGWSYEGIGWYSDPAKSVPLYRQYNPNAKAGSHNYTTNKAENDMLVRIGWRAEGIGWYGMK